MKNIRIFYVKNCQFLVVKVSVYLNRRVFVIHVSNKFVWSAIRWKMRSMFAYFVENIQICVLHCLNKLNLKIPVLKTNTNELINTSSAVDTKLICKFIHEALELR